MRRRIQYLLTVGLSPSKTSVAVQRQIPAMAAAVLFWIGIFVFIPSASGGPPFLTDDPEPVDYKHWEFYLAHMYTNDKNGIFGTAPHIEVNHGVVPNVQLHLLAPLAYNRPHGEAAQYGFGDLELGVKYRFVQETDTRPMVGTFPLIHLPTGDQSRGLGNGDPQFFLPFWFQKGWGPWQTYGGGGYWINPGTGNKNYWFLGWQGQRDLTKWLTLGAEIFYVTPPTTDSSHQVGYNIGGFINFTEEHHLIFSAGSDIYGDTHSRYYIAYLFTWGLPQRLVRTVNERGGGKCKKEQRA